MKVMGVDDEYKIVPTMNKISTGNRSYGNFPNMQFTSKPPLRK